MSVRDPILASKITAPGVPDWAVQRPRISKLIAEGTQWCPLTVVTGPPGAGKTTALALWAAPQPRTVAWVTVDEHDNRPGVFWSQVLAALRRSGVSLPRALSAAASVRTADHLFVLRVAAALAVQDPPVNLVLDDLHLLTDPTVLEGLDFVLRNAGSGLRLAVCSRMDPPLPLHRYRLAGQLTEIRGSDLAFSTAEAGLLLAQHTSRLSADAVACLTERTEGWAAGLRLAAISLAAHPDPDQFITELTTEDSALTGYLVEEALNIQPPQVRDVLLSTSILDQVSAEAATVLAADERAAGILLALAGANAFVQRIGAGWYRYHTLFAEVLRLKLRREYPDRVAVLHQRAAQWYQRNGLLTTAVGHAAQGGNWPLAASMVIDDLAISQIIEPGGGQPLAGEFVNMPSGQSWAEPEPHLISAAVALSAGRPDSSAAELAAAESILECVPADQKVTCRLAAAMVGLAVSRRTGDLTAAASAATRAEVLIDAISSDKIARRPQIREYLLSRRGAVELWSGHFHEAARLLREGVAIQTASGSQAGPADCLGHLALAEALQGQLRHAAQLAGQAAQAADEHQPPGQNPNPAALVTLAWVHLEHHELHQARDHLKQADAALRVSPDKLIEAVACLVAARIALAAGRAAAAAQTITREQSGWPVPAWLDHKLSLVKSRAYAASGDIQAALTAAEQAGGDNSPEASIASAHAWAAAGNADNAWRMIAPVLAANSGAPARVRLQACLLDARLGYTNGDHGRARRSLASALRLAEPEQLRLPFELERSWIEPVLQRAPELASTHWRLLAPTLRHDQLQAPGVPDQAVIPVVEPLTEREQEVLRHVSRMLDTAEVASQMYISVNTVKSHIKSINRKLATAHRREAVRRARQLELI